MVTRFPEGGKHSRSDLQRYYRLKWPWRVSAFGRSSVRSRGDVDGMNKGNSSDSGDG